MLMPDDYRALSGYRRSEAEKKSSVFDGGDILRELLAQGTSKSGQSVTLRTAMEVVTVLACARVIAEGLATVPAKIYQKVGSARRDASDHPAAVLLSREPNGWQTGFELREQIGYHLALCGNAFVFKNYSASGELLEIFAYEPGAVTVERAADMTLSYRVRVDRGAEITIPAQNMWHLRGPSFNGYLGLDAVAMARNAIGLALATEEFASKLFSNGARPGGLLTTDQNLTAEQIQMIKTSWSAAQSGSGNAMRTALLTNGLRFEKLAQDADEAQFIETRREIVVEICRAMRVSPIMVMHNDNQAAYASVEQRYIAHHRDTLAPWFTRFEASANINLFSAREQRAGYYAKLDGRALMRGTAKERAEFYAIMLQNGIVSRNEVRAWEDWEPIEDPAFDTPMPAANLFGPTGGAQTPDNQGQ